MEGEDQLATTAWGSGPEDLEVGREACTWPWVGDSLGLLWRGSAGRCDVRSRAGILDGMPDSTTIKVSVRTRDALRRLADREGLTFDAQLEKMIQRERRRIIGAQLASAPLDADDEAVLDASASDVADASG